MAFPQLVEPERHDTLLVTESNYMIERETYLCSIDGLARAISK